MSGKKVSAGHVVGAEEQDRSAAEELLEAKGDTVIIGDEEEPEELGDSEESKTPLESEKSEVDAGHGDGPEEAEKELKQTKGTKQTEGTKQRKVMLKRAGSYWGRGKKYQREEAVLVSQEEYLYLLGTGLFDEVK